MCRRCGEVLILESAPEGAALAAEPEAAARPEFPPPRRVAQADPIAQLASKVGLGLAALGIVLMAAGAAMRLGQLALGGIGMIVSGWLVAAGRMIGIYFYTLAWLLMVIWAAKAEIWHLNGRMAFALQVAIPSLVLVVLWFKLPAIFKGVAGGLLRDRYTFTADGEMVDFTKREANPTLVAVAGVLGVALAGAGVWGAFVREPTHQGKAAAYWLEEAKNTSPARRVEAVVALGRINRAETVTALAEALNDGDATVRAAAVGALHYKEAAGAKYLTRALWSDYRDVRAMALKALEQGDLYTAEASRIEAERANNVQPPRK
jgi:hypothetical protein